MAGPIFISTITFMLWLLVDIYFVAASVTRLSPASVPPEASHFW